MKLFKQGELKLLWSFYLTAFMDFSLSIAPLILFVYFSQKGFDIGLAALLIAVSNLSGFIFEIPTGIFADTYGRKLSTLIYYFVSGTIFLVVPFLIKSSYLLVIFFIWGISITFRSGAKEAWIVDNLKSKRRKDLIQPFYTKLHIILAIGTIIAGLILSLILFIFPSKMRINLFGINLIGLDIVWILEGIGWIISGFILLFIEENFKPKRSSVKKDFRESLKLVKKGFSYAYKHSVIFALIISALLSTIFINIRWSATQPFMLENGIPIGYFGYIATIIAIAGIFLPFVSEFFVKKVKKNIYLAILASLTFLSSFLILFVAGPIFAFVYFFFVRSLGYLGNPVEGAYFQENIPSKERATIGSILNIFYSLGGLIALGIGGFALNLISPAMFIFLGSFLLIPIIIIFLRIKDGKKQSALSSFLEKRIKKLAGKIIKNPPARGRGIF